MSPRMATALVLLAALAAGAVLLAADEAGDPAPAAPPAADRRPQPVGGFAGARIPDGVRAPDFALRNEDGELVRMRDLRGRPAVVTFMYTTCEESCPPQAQQIKGGLEELGHDVPVIAIAVDPPRDTAGSARRFLEEVRMRDRMDFVLGTREQLEPLWEAYAIQPQSRAHEHQARTVLVDERGFQRVGFPLDRTTPERLAHDLRLLEAE